MSRKLALGRPANLLFSWPPHSYVCTVNSLLSLTFLIQEKLDHVAIVVLIVGTPVTQSMAAAHGAIPRDVVVVTALMAVAAACRPVLRVVGFVVGSIIWGTQHLELLTPSMLLQSALYIFGAASFLRSVRLSLKSTTFEQD